MILENLPAQNGVFHGYVELPGGDGWLGQTYVVSTLSYWMMIPTDQYGKRSLSLADKGFDPCNHMQHSELKGG